MYYSEELPNFVYTLIDKIQPNPLSNLEKEIIQGIWNGLCYRDIAKKCKKKYSSKSDKYADKYISNTGAELLNKFNEGLKKIGLEKKINKRNFRNEVLSIKEDIIRELEKLGSPDPVEESEHPDRPVPLNSPFYVKRKLEASGDRTIEDLAKQTIKKSGAVIRIIGARKSGATSLVNRITHHAESFGDRSVTIDFKNIEDGEPLASIQSFMEWFCREVSAQLDLKDSFNEYFNSDDWSNSRASSCSEKYFERHLLTKLSAPSSLLIVFDRIDYVFDERYEDTPRIVTARLFFALIRTWIERGSKIDVWKKVKYVIVQGKNEIEMGNKCSPFNIGEEIYLDNFSIPEIVDLAGRHQLNWSESEIEKLANIFGENFKNPHLIRRVFHRAERDNLTFEKFGQLDLTKNSVFNKYLEN